MSAQRAAIGAAKSRIWIASRSKAEAAFVSYHWESRQFCQHDPNDVHIHRLPLCCEPSMSSIFFVPFSRKGEKGDTVVFSSCTDLRKAVNKCFGVGSRSLPGGKAGATYLITEESAEKVTAGAGTCSITGAGAAKVAARAGATHPITRAGAAKVAAGAGGTYSGFAR